MIRLRYILCIGVLVGLAACGGSSSKSSSPTTAMNDHAACSPSGTALKIVATGVSFDKKCLAAPANQAFTLELDNQAASIEHNLSIYSADPMKDSAAKTLFQGEHFNGVATKTYNVPALAAGTYHFHCDVHPTTMDGTFVVA